MKLRIHRHDVVDSTSERAFAALADGTGEHGDVHIARAQSQGRGRLGRAWESASGQGLYFSLILRPGPPQVSPVALTMLSGLAVYTAVHELGIQAAELNWPNDVVVDGAKLSGILVESRGLDPNDPAYVVGIGLNVLQQEFSPELTGERPVTSLALLGASQGVEGAADAVTRNLSQRLDQPHKISPELGAEYLVATGLQGRTVRIAIGSETEVGEVADITLGSGLLLSAPDGTQSLYALEHIRSLEALEPS